MFTENNFYVVRLRESREIMWETEQNEGRREAKRSSWGSDLDQQTLTLPKSSTRIVNKIKSKDWLIYLNNNQTIITIIFQ